MSRICMLLVAGLVLAAPIAAELKTYTLDGDQSTLFPTDGTILRAGSVSGTAVIADDGDGSPTLHSLELTHGYIEFFVQNSSAVGTFELQRNLTAAPGQVR